MRRRGVFGAVSSLGPNAASHMRDRVCITGLGLLDSPDDFLRVINLLRPQFYNTALPFGRVWIEVPLADTEPDAGVVGVAIGERGVSMYALMIGDLLMVAPPKQSSQYADPFPIIESGVPVVDDDGLVFQTPLELGSPLICYVDGCGCVRSAIPESPTAYERSIKSFGRQAQLGLMAAAATLSFLHVKNIQLEDEPLTRAQRRRMERTGRGVVYKILTVTNAARRKRESGAATSERFTRLHLVRGHFATYTEDAPLFGKLTGTYWIPPHTRGDVDVGVVEKSYRAMAVPAPMVDA